MNYHLKVRASALVIEDSRILLVEFNDETGLHYNLPGGTIESGETIIEGLKREVREETDADIEVGNLIFVLEYEPQRNSFWAGRIPALSLIFDCKIVENSKPQMPIMPDVYQTGVKWINIGELGRIELLPHLAKQIIEYAYTGVNDKIFWEEPLKPGKAQAYLK